MSEYENLLLAQKKMTHMLKVFHNICVKYDLKYWCLGGTLVGAVRHGGWVPWDGDVDVAMLEEDYKKLTLYINNELPSTMYFFSRNGPEKFNGKEDMPEGISKIRDLYSSYIDFSNRNDSKHHGLQLDIFPYRVEEIENVKYVLSIHDLQPYNEDRFKFNSIFPLRITKFDSIDVYIPNEIEEICEYSYGGFPPPLPPLENRFCHEGRIDPINPAWYYPNVFKDIYQMKTQQWFSEKALENGIPLHHMSGWNYLTEETWGLLCVHVLDNIKLTDCMSVFDAGCGCGAFFNYIQKKNPSTILYGCDVNKNAVVTCKNFFPRATIKLSNILDLTEYKDNSFDLSVSISTLSYLHSLEDVYKAVNELLRVTKTGGRVHVCINTEINKTLKSFNVLIPKSFWKVFDIFNVKIIDIPLKEFDGRYSIFLQKNNVF